MSLANAMRAFVAGKHDRSSMDVPHWAETYRCGVEDVRKAWEAAMSEASTKPQNKYGEGEGK